MPTAAWKPWRWPGSWVCLFKQDQFEGQENDRDRRGDPAKDRFPIPIVRIQYVRPIISKPPIFGGRSPMGGGMMPTPHEKGRSSLHIRVCGERPLVFGRNEETMDLRQQVILSTSRKRVIGVL